MTSSTIGAHPEVTEPGRPTARVRSWRRIDSLVLAGYVVVAAVKLADHPMWRDELQSWDLARTSDGIGQVLARVRYEEHPPLWYVLLWCWSRLSPDPRMLQALALVLVALSAAFVLRFAPWPRPFRWLVLAGYYPLFEWSTISRPYLLTFLLGIVAAELIRRRWTGLPLAAVLAALVLTDDSYGLALAGALLVAVAVDARRSGTLRRHWPLGAVMAGAVLVAAWSDLPPHDYGGPQLALSWNSVGDALTAPSHALLPLPTLSLQFWNTYLLDVFGVAVAAALSVAGLVGVTWLLRHDRRSQLLWVVGLLGVCGVQLLTGLPYARFVGFIVVVLLCSFWVHGSLLEPACARVLTAYACLLGLQVPGGVMAVAEASAHPFSESAAAGAAVAHLPGRVIAVRDEAAVPVSAYADRPLIMADGQPRASTYVTWDRQRLCAGKVICSTGGALYEALTDARWASLEGGPTWVLLDFPAPPQTANLVFVRSWDDAVVNEEDYWLYEYVAVPPTVERLAPLPRR